MNKKHFLAFLTTCMLAFSPGFSAPGATSPTPEGYTVISNQTKLPILTHALSERQTQKIRLDNGLEAYLISNPKATLSGAMISVHAGSWEDPDEHPGLAHFLEHMLFLGTLKYPKESEYESFITAHGGESNAFTTDDTTSFLFTIDTDAFPESLARFSSFFKEPLFNPSGVGSEMQAIDQEYAKNIEKDTVRLNAVLKDLANQKSPLHKFTMGNSASLATATRENLEKWFLSHYSANLMRLVVYSPLPIDRLRQLVVRDFSNIANTNLQTKVVESQALPSDLEGKFVFIEPIKDTRSVTIIWELPPRFAKMRDTQPEELVSFVLGHEGDKSLLAQLKREKLAEELASGGVKFGDNLMMEYVEIKLTTEGLRDIDQVIARTFQAIKVLQEKGIPEYLFNEIKQMDTIKYQYPSQDKEFAMLMKHAMQIQDENFSTYPEYSEIVQKYDPAILKDFIAQLTPQNARFFVMAPSKLTSVHYDRKEKWVGVDYAVRAVPAEMMDKWKHPPLMAEIDLPLPNIFIPNDLKLVGGSNFVPSGNLMPSPLLLVEDARSKMYFAGDDQFGNPMVSWYIHILTPEITLADSVKVVLGDIFVKGVKDTLDKFSYPAQVAGLNYDIKREDNGILININGYSQSASRLLDEVMKGLTTYEPTTEKFNIYKDSLLRQYQNFAKESPLDQSVEVFKSLLYKDFVTDREKAAAIRKVTFKRFQEFVASVFNRTYVEAMLYGNLKEDQARGYAKKINSVFSKGVYPKNEHLVKAVIVLPKTQGPFFFEAMTKTSGNAALLAIQNTTFTFKERAAQQVLMQAIKEPFFTALRTQQQTGYLVVSMPEEVERKLYNLFAVQSSTQDARDLLARFEAFVEKFLGELEKREISHEQFDVLKNGILVTLKRPADSIKSMGELLNTLAFEYDGDFDWIAKRIQGLNELSYGEFLAISRDILGKQNKRRLAVLVKGELPTDKTLSYTRAGTWNMIRKASIYQSRENGN